MCNNQFPAVFTQNPTPVLVATRDYEGGCVVEPNIILGPDKLFHMTYSCDAFYHNGFVETIGLATARRPEGPWKRYGNTPIIGGGYCGFKEPAGQSSQIKIGPEYRIYFSGLMSRHIFYATSKDGYHYTLQSTPVITTNQFKTYGCTGGSALDGMGIIYDGTTYWGLAEVHAANCPINQAYVLWLLKSPDDAKTFYIASALQLNGLNPFYPKNYAFAGGRAIVKAGKHYHVWTHVDMPTNIYHGESNDLFNWKSEPIPVVRTHANMFGLPACDQAADASIIEYKGKTYLFYDGTDNPHGTGAIGYSVYNGTLEQYDACENVNLTNTPTAGPQGRK